MSDRLPPCDHDECPKTRCMMNQPWPLRDVVEKLCEAAEILLHQYDYDCHGHEAFSQAVKSGREWLDEQNQKGKS